jgi:hypothetical protein
LAADLELELGGKVVEGKRFEKLLRLAAEILPGKVERPALYDSLRGCLGEVMTAERAQEIGWRLAGNLPRLRLGRAAPPWHVQKFLEWVPLHVVGCRPELRGRGKRGVLYSFRVLGGSPCPRILQQWFSVKWCRVVAVDFGFSPRGRRPKFPYSAPEQIVGLRFCGLVDPELSGGEPVFRVPLEVSKARGLRAHGHAFPGYCRDYNRGALERRFRTEPAVFDCPRDLPRDYPCHRCPSGFGGAGGCPAATHRAEWAVRPCPRCDLEAAFFDPELPGDLCVDCHRREAYRGAKT